MDLTDGVGVRAYIPELLGDVLEGRINPGRTSSEQITLYGSVGVAVQDGVAAALALRAAREQSVGREVEL